MKNKKSGPSFRWDRNSIPSDGTFRCLLMTLGFHTKDHKRLGLPASEAALISLVFGSLFLRLDC